MLILLVELYFHKKPSALNGVGGTVERVSGALMQFEANLMSYYYYYHSASLVPAVTIPASPLVGSGRGISRVLAGNVDFGASDGPLSVASESFRD
jgi:ABC-type phosphate transport system substrate-binding protein